MRQNLRRAKFVREFLRTGNAAEAARRAGYSQRVARQQGADLLSKPDVQAAIAKARARAEEQGILNLVEAKRILSRIARARLGAFIEPDSSIAIERVRKAAQEIGEFEVSDTDAGRRRRIKLRDPVAAIERLARLSGWDAPERHQIEGAVLVIE